MLLFILACCMLQERSNGTPLEDIVDGRLGPEVNTAAMALGKLGGSRKKLISVKFENVTHLINQDVKRLELLLKLQTDSQNEGILPSIFSKHKAFLSELAYTAHAEEDGWLSIPLNTTLFLGEDELQFKISREGAALHLEDVPALVAYSHEAQSYELLLEETPGDAVKGTRKRRGLEDNLTDSSSNLPCHREHLYYKVNNPNVYPSEIDIYQCVGTCSDAPRKMLTTHAKLQVSMASRQPGSTSLPCCVPVQYEHLTFTVHDGPSITKFTKYEEAKAKKCGCR